MARLRYCVLFLLLVFKNINTEEYNLNGLHGQAYWLDINIGHPYQKFKVVLDTGSSTLAVASPYSSPKIKAYFDPERSETAVDTGRKIASHYINSSWEAKLITDFVQIPSQSHIPEVMTDIGLITSEDNFFTESNQSWQGILGLAYPILGVPDEKDVKSKTWLDGLYRKRGRPSSFDIKLCGEDEQSKPYHYGRFRILDDGTPKDNNNTVFSTPVVRPWWYEVVVLSVRLLHSKPADPTYKSNNITEDGNEPNLEMCKALNKDIGFVIDSGTTNVRLPTELFNQVRNELKEAVDTLNLTYPLEDSYWNGQTTCLPESVDWSKTGLPYLAFDFVSHENHSEYFTIEIPPESYMHRAGAGGPRCYRLGVEGGRGPGLGVVALEGLQVTFDRTYDVIRFQKSDCGPPIRISGPYKSKHDYYKQCKLSKLTFFYVSPPYLTIGWACLVFLGLAFAVMVMIVDPRFIPKCFRPKR